MLMHSGVGLACRLAVARHTSIVFDLRRVVEIFVDRSMTEDIFSPKS